MIGGLTLAEYGIDSLTWIEIALVIFITVFVGVVIWVMFAKRGAFNDAARIPLDDENVMTRREVHARTANRKRGIER